MGLTDFWLNILLNLNRDGDYMDVKRSDLMYIMFNMELKVQVFFILFILDTVNNLLKGASNLKDEVYATLSDVVKTFSQWPHDKMVPGTPNLIICGSH